MKRMARFLSYLYPPAWRTRYGAEFKALLEEVEARPSDVLNVFAGAIRMHMTEWSYLKVLTAFVFVGVLAGTAAQLMVHDRYASRGVVSAPSERRAIQAAQQLLSRPSLKEVIDRNKLYSSERLREPLEDVIETMRTRDLEVKPISSGQMSVTFLYPDGAAAQRTVGNLMARLASDSAFQTAEAASAPQLKAPNRSKLFVFFVCLASVLGLVTAGLVHTPRRFFKTVALFAATGAVLAYGTSYLLPERYVAHAVLSAVEGSELPLAALRNAARVKENCRLEQDVPGGTSVLKFTCFASNPYEAQRRVQGLIDLAAAKGTTVEALEKATLPQSSIWPNHEVIALIGLLLGLVVGLVRARLPAIRRDHKVAVSPG